MYFNEENYEYKIRKIVENIYGVKDVIFFY